MAYEHRAATISQTALTYSPPARARTPPATAPSGAMAVQMAIRRGVQRPVAEVEVAVTAILLWAGPGLRMASRAGHGGHQGVGWPCARTTPAARGQVAARS